MAPVTHARRGDDYTRAAWILGVGILAIPTVYFLVIDPAAALLNLHLGRSGQLVDDIKPTAQEVAEHGVETTKFLVSLSTAVLGFVGYITKDGWSKIPRVSRVLMFGGAAFALLSIATGFAVFHTILRASADAIVRASVDQVISLHAMQLGEIFVAVVLFGAAFWASIPPHGG